MQIFLCKTDLPWCAFMRRATYLVQAHAGQAMPGARPVGLRVYAASIRARPFGRAMQTIRALREYVASFQSAPGLSAGRCTASDIDSAAWRLFQSAPGLSAGRCFSSCQAPSDINPFQSAPGLSAGRCPATSLADTSSVLFQSAPGLSAGRCMPSFPLCPASSGFNPRPAFRPGDAPGPCLRP